jgi:hypothetical protein
MRHANVRLWHKADIPMYSANVRNGRIWVSAGVPRGSIFQFELPVYQSGERKSDWSDRTSATLNGSPPLVADEVIE